MTHNENSNRRSFLQNTSRIAAASTLVAASGKQVHAAESGTIQIGLVGCGGRGTGAARNALSVENGPVELVAMGDVFENKLRASEAALSSNRPGRRGGGDTASKMNVPEERRFIGFDAYKKVMDFLSPGDVVILATPPAFRWVQYQYAVERGLNVFMEKPVTVDGPTCGKMLEINKLAVEKNLKVAVGLMCRHCKARQELFDRIGDGQIGDITMLRAYRMAGPTGSAAAPANNGTLSPLMHQIRHFHGFLWLSGGAVSDFLIHNIDESCWMKDAWPVKAIGLGGRHYRGDFIDQNFDSYAMEYTFADGTKLFVDGRTMPGCKNEFASYAHGTKGLAVISSASHTPAKARIYNGHSMDKANLAWSYPQPEPNPYQLEWDDLIAAIRDDQPYNEVERGVMASAVTSMGRMAAHTGQEITLEKFLSNGHEFAPGLEDLTMESDSPLMPLPNGKYSVPMPGLVKKREYL